MLSEFCVLCLEIHFNKDRDRPQHLSRPCQPIDRMVKNFNEDKKWFTLRISTDEFLILIFLSWVFFTRKKFIPEVNAVKKCTVRVENGVKVAGCSEITTFNFELPQNLDEDIKTLDISMNNFKSITKKSFERYKNSLTKLNVSYFQPNVDETNYYFDEEIFASLHKLKHLIMLGCSYLKKPKFPPSLVIINIESCYTNDWTFENLEALESFLAIHNRYTVFPVFHDLAPLKFVDLRYNPVNFIDLHLQTLARYCQLKSLLLSPQPVDKPTLETYCNCMKLEWWFHDYNILHESMECEVPKIEGPKADCSFKLKDKEKELREECLSRLIPDTMGIFKRNLYLFLIGVAIFFAISIPIVLFARRKFGVKARKKRRRRRKKLMKKWKQISEHEIPEEYYEEYDEEGNWEDEEEEGERSEITKEQYEDEEKEIQ